jgi:hypothetical protein
MAVVAGLAIGAVAGAAAWSVAQRAPAPTVSASSRRMQIQVIAPPSTTPRVGPKLETLPPGAPAVSAEAPLPAADRWVVPVRPPAPDRWVQQPTTPSPDSAENYAARDEAEPIEPGWRPRGRERVEPPLYAEERRFRRRDRELEDFRADEEESAYREAPEPPPPPPAFSGWR